MIISPAGSLPVTQAAIVAGNVVVKATAGMLCTVVITTVTAGAALAIFDNATTASGTIVGAIPIGATVGQIFTFNMPVNNGIVVGQQAAFTGAIKDKPGRLEAANAGTVFLDEIAELPLTLQTKFLRFLQDERFERVGQ